MMTISYISDLQSDKKIIVIDVIVSHKLIG